VRRLGVLITVALALVLIIPRVSSARTWNIARDGTGDAPTIQAGIDSSAVGDTVSLVDGTYTGPGNWDVDFRGRQIVVRSASSIPDACIIDCSDPSWRRGFIFSSGESSESILEGITIQNAYHSSGGGVYCSGSSPTITNVVFRDNSAEIAGGGMLCEGGSSPAITSSTFKRNSAMDGGGMSCSASSPILIDVVFQDNYTGEPGLGGGLACAGVSSPELINVAFVENSSQTNGGGVAVWGGSTPILTNVLFWENRAMSAGGAISCTGGVSLTACTFVLNSSPEYGAAIHTVGSPAVTIERSIVAFNFGSDAIFASGGDCPELTCCDIFDNYLGDWIWCIADQESVRGNFSQDPLFCDLSSGDFTLEECSPCLPGNHPDGYSCGGVMGADGAGCECSSGTEPTTWGAIKASYR